MKTRGLTGVEYYENEQKLAKELLQKGITPKPYIKANQTDIEKGLADKNGIWYSDEELESFYQETTQDDISIHKKATELMQQHLDNPNLSTKDLLAIKEQSFKEIRTITNNDDKVQELIPSQINIQIINN